MVKTYVYRSILAPYIEGLICQKRANGFIYEYEAYILKTFDDFCISKDHHQPCITRELVMEWAIQRETEGLNYRAQRVSFIRQLSLYMNSLGINSYIPHHFSSEEITIPHIMNQDELSSLFTVVDSYCSGIGKYKRFSYEYKVLLRLFYCCGLRLAEACYLKKEDVDIDKGILRILKSKGRKDRIVYMADDVTSMCREYWRNICKEIPDSVWFFPGRDTVKPILKSTLDLKFSQFWSKTPYASKCDKQPTVHALRHTFVVNRMNQWMLDGLDLNTMLPYLSKYLGHATVEDTFYYYHQVDKAFRIVRQKDYISKAVIPEVTTYEE